MIRGRQKKSNKTLSFDTATPPGEDYIIMPICKFHCEHHVRTITVKSLEIFSRNLVQI